MDLDSRLIQLVFERKPLWDQTTKEYHNRDATRKLWAEVANELNESCELIKSKWRGLRDNFCKEMAKYTKVHSGAEGGDLKKSKWAFFESVLFLKHTIGSRNMSGNIPPPETETSNVEAAEEENQITTDEDTSDTIVTEGMPTANIPKQKRDVSEFQIPPPKKKRNDAVDKMIILEKEKLEILRKNADQKQDGDYHFLMSLLPELSKISSHRKLQVRMKLQQVLMEEQETRQQLHTFNYGEGSNYISPTSPYSSTSSAQESSVEADINLPNLQRYFHHFQE